MKPLHLISCCLAFALLPACEPLLGQSTPESQDSKPWVGQIADRQYFAISVSEMEPAIDWYRRALGLAVLDDTSAEDGRWRIVNLTRTGLAVELIQDRRDKAPAGRVQGLAKVGFEVADLEAIADRVASSGEQRPRVLDFAKHNIRLLQLRDPDGNVLQLFSPLPGSQKAPPVPSPEQAGQSITRINRFAAKPGLGDSLYALIESFVPMIEGSAGCLGVELKRSLDNPDQIVVIESWRDRAAHRGAAANIPAGTLEKAMALMAEPPSGAYYQ